MNTIIIISAAALAIYIMFIVIPAAVAGIIIFKPHSVIPISSILSSDSYYNEYRDVMKEDADHIGSIPCERLSITAKDGTELLCDYRKNKNSDKTAVFFHGFRSDPLTNFSSQARLLYENGYNIAFVLQRGHIGREGKHNGMGIIESSDVLDWCGYFGKEAELLLYGMSMGSTALAYAAESLDENTVRGIVLDCGFSSPGEQIKRDGIKRHLPSALLMPYIRLTAKLFVKIDISKSIYGSLEKCRVPVLFFHGKSDTTVSYDDSVKAFEKCKSPKKIILTDGAEHTLSFLKGGDTTANALLSFSDEKRKDQ